MSLHPTPGNMQQDSSPQVCVLMPVCSHPHKYIYLCVCVCVCVCVCIYVYNHAYTCIMYIHIHVHVFVCVCVCVCVRVVCTCVVCVCTCVCVCVCVCGVCVVCVCVHTHTQAHTHTHTHTYTCACTCTCMYASTGEEVHWCNWCKEVLGRTEASLDTGGRRRVFNGAPYLGVQPPLKSSAIRSANPKGWAHHNNSMTKTCWWIGTARQRVRMRV